MHVLVIGAAGRVGSAALAACLSKHHTVTALLRHPSRLPLEVHCHPRLRIIQGDTLSHASLVEAIRDQDAIIHAASYGSKLRTATHASDQAIASIIKAVKEVQASRRKSLSPSRGMRMTDRGSIRLWVLSDQVLTNIPQRREGGVEGDVYPIDPEHYRNYAFLQQQDDDVVGAGVERRLCCPANTREIRVLLYVVD